MKALRLAIILTLLATAIGLILAASIQNLTITPTPDSDSPTTEDEIVCSWTPSGDMTDQNATWYRNSIFYSQNDTPTANQLKLAPLTAKKDENWTCSVSLSNGTATVVQNTSFTIRNADPATPNATNANIYEDNVFNQAVHSADADNDTVAYYKIKGPTFCIIGETTGQVSCLVTHADLTPSTQKTYNLTYLALDEDIGTSAKNVTYTAYEVNDRPDLTLIDQDATEGTPFNYTFSATDEESHLPITFTITSNSSSIIIQTLGNASAGLTFNRPGNAPTLADKGIWWVAVNATDTGPSASTPYDDPTAIHNITITVSTINHPPTIITNLSVPILGGMQGTLFNFTVYANDSDPEDTLNFSITSDCNLANPWSIATTNSSAQNAAGLVNLTLTNDHVVCRNINVTVSDGEEEDRQEVALDIINTNDPPYINRYSYDPSNTGTDMDNLTVVKGITFYYQVNATDNDSLTYDSEVLSYSDNSTLFNINPASGVLTFLANSTHVGNHTININVTDDEGLWNDRDLHLEVKNNTAPTLDPIGNLSCAEDMPCTRYITAQDPDAGEDLLFTTNDTAHFPITDYNTTAWLFNLTATNNMVDNYSITVTVTDRYGFSDSENFTIQINNTNDVPFFDADQNDAPDSIDFGIVVIDHTTTYLANVTDEDLDLGIENLTFNYTFLVDPGNLEGVFSLIKLDENTARISFTPVAGQNGTHVVNISVTDLQGTYDWQNVSFNVLAPSTPPNITNIMPYFSTLTNQTVTGSFINTSGYPYNTTDVNFTEDTNVTFDSLATNDTGVPANKMTYAWYLDGQLQETIANANPGTNSSVTIPFGYFDAGNHTVELVITDVRYSTANWTWLVNVTDLNRPPVLLNPLQNISVNRSTTMTDYFAYHMQTGTWLQHFYDPDDDLNSDGHRAGITGEATNLTYTLLNATSCTIASISAENDDLTISPSAIGTCLLTFRATDQENETVDSNVVWLVITTIDVQEVEVPTSSSTTSTTRPQPIPLPIEEPVNVPHPLVLIIPREVKTYTNGTVLVSLDIVNTWDKLITGVKLTANTTNGTLNMTFSFSDDEFAFLEPNETVNTILTIGNYREEGPVNIEVKATVEDPDYSDTANVLLSSLEKRDTGEDVENKITFARDLLNDNPECQELNELLVKAEKERLKKNYDEAIKLVNTVVNGCKYLVNERVNPTVEHPKEFFSLTRLPIEQLPALAVGIALLAVLLIFSIVMVISGRKNKNLKGI